MFKNVKKCVKKRKTLWLIEITLFAERGSAVQVPLGDSMNIFFFLRLGRIK